MNHTLHTTFLSRFLAHLAIICLVFNPIALSAQTLPITPDGATAVSVTHTSSGIDQINIAAPNSSGLSHNTFTDYSVNVAGQVINNFSGKDLSEVVEGTGGTGVALTSSHIAGLVAANPNLSSSGSARIILNEVTSSNDSQLLGYTEIAGTKAELIIANPNGITCSGCGFINTSRLSMIAGKSEFDQNSNLGFNLEKPPAALQIPLITISGLGLDAESTSATDIVASSIKLISTIYGSEQTDISIKTSNGKYDHATKSLTTTKDQPTTNSPELFALDASNLGAIQSGRIFIVATQDGFGVNLGKNLLATKSLNIDSAGNLYYENLTSPKINIKSTSDITQSGNIITSGNLDIETAKTFTNFGILKSDASINLTANSLENSFLINAKNLNISSENFLNKNGGIIGSFAIQNDDGTAAEFKTEKASLTGKNFSNFGNVKAENLAFSIYQLTNSGNISAEKNSTFGASEIDNSGNIFSAGNLFLGMSYLKNSGKIQSSTDLQITGYDLKNTGTILASQNLNFFTFSLNNDGEISSQTNLNINAAGEVRNSNKIFSNEVLNISADKLTNSGDASITSLSGSLSLHLRTGLENNGELYSKKNLAIEGDEFSNFGNILSAENLSLNVYQLTNYGTLQSVGDSELTAFRLENYGEIKSFKTSAINAYASMNDALIFSAENLSFNASHLTNYGTIQSSDQLQLAATNLRNSGNILANNDLNIAANTTENRADSTIASINKSLTFNLSDQLTNAGTIFAKENFSLKNFSTDSELNSVNNSGNISFAQLIDGLKVKNFTNSGSINSAQNLTITSSENFNNFGNILSSKDLTINNSQLTNSGILQSASNLQLTTNNLENTGSIKSFQNATINSNIIENKVDALIFSAENLTINNSQLTNFGAIFAQKELGISNDQLTNSGEIQSTYNLRLTTNDLENSGKILSSSNSQLTTSNLTNSGEILSNYDLNIVGNNIANSSSGAISSLTKSLTLALTNNLKNDGELSAASDLVARSKNFNNSGNVFSSSDLELAVANSLTNFGSIQSTNNLQLTSSNLENTGSIKSFQNATINSNIIENKVDALIFSAENLTINNSQLTNFGVLQSNHDLHLTTINLENAGTIFAKENFSLKNFSTDSELNSVNNSGNISFAQLIDGLKVKNFTNSGSINSAQNLTITSSENFNNFGNILGSKDLSFNASSLTNSGILQSANNLQLTTNNLENTGSIKSFQNATISSNIIENKVDALIFSAENLTINNSQLTNFGAIFAQKELGISNDQLTNFGILQSASNLQLTTNNLNNSGSIQSTYDLRLTTIDLENSGEISSQNNLTLNASTDITNSKKILANGTLNITANNLNNSGNAAIASLADSLTLTLKNDLKNYGEISATKNLTASGRNFFNYSDILAGENLAINNSQLTNSGILQSANNLQLTTSNLENAGSIKSFQTSTINADSIANQTNALIFSANNATIFAKNSLTNSGRIFSNSKLDLTSGLTTNNNEIFSTGDLKLTLTKDLNNTGSINSLADLNVISSSSITNSNQILSSRNLTLSASNLINSNNIQSGGNLTLNLATLSNSKNIISGGNFNITASGNISNSSILQSANNFTINAANLTNSAFSLIFSAKDLTIKALSITNKNTRAADNSTSSGLIATSGIIALQTDSLNNDSGMIAAKSTILNPFTSGKNVILSNVGGKFLSTNSISLNLGAVDYTITGEISAQDIDITANNITNLGNVTANDFIKLNATGSIAASNGNIINGIAGGNNSNVKLSAGSYLTATAARFILNYGTISANSDLTLTSNYSLIRNYGTISGGNGTTIVNTRNSDWGYFENYVGAKLTSNNNLIINSAKDLNNFGEISVKNDLTANVSSNLNNNPTALIWSGRDATFNVANNFVNTQAEIYAERNLTIQKNLNGEKINLLQNISGNIETYSGDILIKAATLENKRAIDVVSKRLAMPNPTIGLSADWVYQQSWCGGNYCGAWRHIYVATVTKNSNSKPGIIFSGKDLNISSSIFTNNLSELYSSKNMNVYASSVFNNTFLSTIVGRIVFVGGHDYSEIYNTTGFGNRDDRYDYESYRFPKMTQKDLTTFSSLIKSGGSMYSTAGVYINNSTIAQNTTINSATQLSKSTSVNQFDRFTITQTGIINLDLSRIISAINSNSNQKSIQSQAIEFKALSSGVNLIADQVQSPQLQNIQAQNLALQPQDLTQIQNSESLIPSDSIPQISLQEISSQQIPTNLISSTQLTNNQQPSTNNQNKINLGSIAINSAATLAANPNTPLVEARSQFTNIANYYGSDYLFIKLGLTKSQFLTQLAEAVEKIRLENETLSNQAQQQLNQAQLTSQLTRFLGDSFTESKLLKEQLASLRKDALLLSDDESNSDSEIKSLLDNTATELARLNLTLVDVATKGLTQSQINSLEKNIITFEATNLNGMNIIVPKIYLSLKTREMLAGSSSSSSSLAQGAEDLMSSGSFATNSTIFAKSDLTLNSPTASLLNSGSIISGKNLTLNLSSLTNKTISPIFKSEITAKNNLEITTSGDLKNLGAKITATNNLTLTSLNGNILNSSIVETNDANLLSSNPEAYHPLSLRYSAISSGNISSTLLETASITAKNISITAGNDFTNLAAKILTTDTISPLPSSLAQSAEDLMSSASEPSESNLMGSSELRSKDDGMGNITITAGNDINIGTLQLRNRTEESWGGRRGGGSRITDNLSNLASEISSSGDISFNSGSDLNIVGSNLTAVSDVSLTSTNDINIIAAQNSSFSQSTSWKKGFSTSKSSGDGNATIKNIHANLTSESGDITISSQNNTNLIGVNLNSAANTSITSQGETNIASVTDYSDSYSYSNKSRTGFLRAIPIVGTGINLITATLGSYYNGLSGGNYNKLDGIIGKGSESINSDTTNQEIIASNLAAQNNLTLTSQENLNIKSSNLKTVEGDINLVSNSNINITAAEAIHSANYTSSEKSDRRKLSSDLTSTTTNSASSAIESGGNIAITALNDITLQAAKIKAGTSEEENPQSSQSGQINILAANNLLILTAQDFATSSETNKSKGTYSQSKGNSGSIGTEITNTEISTNDPLKLKLDAGNLIYAEFNPAESRNLTYLTALDSAKSILNPLTELHSSYSQTNRNLTQTGNAIIAVGAAAIAIGTGGIGTGISGAILTAGATTAGTIATTSATNASMNTDGNFLKQASNITKTAVKDTTSKESLEQIAIAGAAAGLAQGATQAAGLGNTANVTNAANGANTTASTIERVATNFSTALQKASIYSTSNILATSAIKGQSIGDTIEQQGGGEKILLNSALQALGEVGAKEIGIAAHGFKTDEAGNILVNSSGEQLHQINKATQLTLHATLGCGLSSGMGGDCASGAAAGVIGELAADAAYKEGKLGADGKALGFSRENSILIGQSSGAVAALFTSIATGQSDQETAKNIQIGNFIGANAATNNATDRFGLELAAAEKDEEKFKEAEKKLDVYAKQVGKDVENLDKAGKAVVAAYQLEYEIEKLTPKFFSPMEVNRQIEAARGSEQTIYQRYVATYKSGNEANGVVSSTALNVGVENVPLKDGRLDVGKVGQPIGFDLTTREGLKDFLISAKEGSLFSHGVNSIIPGSNDMSLTHDNWAQIQLIKDHPLANPVTILPAYIYNSYGLIGKPFNMLEDYAKSKSETNNEKTAQ
jgi:filamentous hemagglutinin